MSPPDANNYASTAWLDLTISYGSPMGLTWSMWNSVVPANAWYYVYISCDNQPWELLDSTQNMYYYFDAGDSVHSSCKFRVLFVDSSGCMGYSGINTFIVNSAEMINSSNQNCFATYPNPASDKLFLSFESSVRNNSIEMFDVYGRKYQVNIFLGSPDNTYEIDVSDLSPGIYYIRSSVCGEVRKLLILR
jgi:hypothetical protein